MVKGNWKAVRLNVDKQPNGPLELYNLADDPDETENVAAEHAEIVAAMAEIMARGTSAGGVMVNA